MPVTLSLVDVCEPDVAADAHLRQVVGADPGHLEQRRDQPVSRSPMADAFADRIDARIERLQRVVDDDAAVAMQARRLRSATLGRMPTAITTSSAGSVSPPRSRTRATRPDSPAIEGSVFASSRKTRPFGLQRRLQQIGRAYDRAAAPSATASGWMTVTSIRARLETVRGFETEQVRRRLQPHGDTAMPRRSSRRCRRCRDT
jgi:hypothetical protein